MFLVNQFQLLTFGESLHFLPKKLLIPKKLPSSPVVKASSSYLRHYWIKRQLQLSNAARQRSSGQYTRKQSQQIHPIYPNMMSTTAASSFGQPIMNSAIILDCRCLACPSHFSLLTAPVLASPDARPRCESGAVLIRHTAPCAVQIGPGCWPIASVASWLHRSFTAARQRCGWRHDVA